MSHSFKTALLSATLFGGLAIQANAAPLITAAVDDNVTTAVTGERSPLLARAKDLGVLADTQILPHVTLVLSRPAAQQAALDKLVHDQLDRNSPSFHRWLKPSDLRGFGPAQEDITKIVSWLQSHGLKVNSVSPSGMSIDFAGTPSAIGAAFHTSLHNVKLPSGEAHIANVTELAIPAALAPVVRGATLSNFFPKPNMARVAPKQVPKPAGYPTDASPNFTIGYNGSTFYLVTPPDFATIYNLNPLFNGTATGNRIAGAGVTIAVVEQTDILRADWQAFRKQFGLSKAAGTLTFQHPHCGDAGFIPDEGEAALDAEWASAAAPDASIIEASCPETALTFGVETTLQNLVEYGTTASVMSISYGGPELENSASFLAGWVNLLEEAAAEGKSVSISSGDSGSSSQENGYASYGLQVNGLSSNPYNTTLGGTDFDDTAKGQNATYWAANNVRQFDSARSYIPEIPWNNACSSRVLFSFVGYADAIDACNDPSLTGIQNGVGGSGGVSRLYPKPDWQNIGVPGMPNDGARDQPDVSLFAANGIWGHFYVFCMSDTNEGGTACDFSNVNDVFGNGAGGTSFAAPIFAGITALLVQKNGDVGLVAPRLYELAKTQFTTAPLTTDCNSGFGNKVSASCTFYNVTLGDNAEPCYATSADCFATNAAVNGIGVLRDPSAPKVNAYQATPGYSLAVGLGTVNITNLLQSY